MADQKPTIPALTGLRFVAALGVVLFHFQYNGVLVFPPVVAPLVDSGREGVGLFFVLSGYVIAFNYTNWFADGFARRGEYLWARVARVTPLHLLGLVLMTPITLLLLNARPQDPPALVGLSWLLNALHLHAWFPAPAFQRWDNPSWSISAEMFFYWLFPAFAYGVLRRGISRRALYALIPGLYLAGAGVQVLLVASTPPHTAAAWYLPLSRVWEFLIGCVLGTLRLRTAPTVGNARGWLIALVAASLIVSAYLAYPGVIGDEDLSWYVVNLPLFGALIALIGAGDSWLSRVLAGRWLVRLGEASYSLYLLHWIVMSSLIFVVRRGWVLPPLGGGLVIVMLVAASLASERWIETPARRWVRALGRAIMARHSEPMRDLYPSAPIAG